MTKKNEITDLTLGGYVNGDDMLFVREMSRTNVYGDEYVTNGKLTKLDLSNAFLLVEGHIIYIIINSILPNPILYLLDYFTIVGLCKK